MFARQEHEVLRRACQANVASDMLGTHLSEVDWDYLWFLAGRHQMTGVLSWRIQDPSLAAVVPSEEIARGASILAAFDGRKGAWLSDVELLSKALQQHGVTYVIRSGPLEYEPLGMGVWPRGDWDDVDVLVDMASLDSLEDTYRAISIVPGKTSSGYPEFRLPSGTKAQISYDSRKTDDVWRFLPAGFFDVIEEHDSFGVTFRVPAPEYLVWYFLRITWESVCFHGAALPLWHLARAVNWMRHSPGWDSSRFFRIIRDTIDDTVARTIASIEAAPNADPSTLAEEMPLPTANLSTLHAWFWCRMADRVLDCFTEAERAEAASVLGTYHDMAPVIDAHAEVAGPYTGTATKWLCDWVWPGDEALLFNHMDAIGFQQKVSAGLWNIRSGPYEINVEQYLEW